MQSKSERKPSKQRHVVNITGKVFSSCLKGYYYHRQFVSNHSTKC